MLQFIYIYIRLLTHLIAVIVLILKGSKWSKVLYYALTYTAN